MTVTFKGPPKKYKKNWDQIEEKANKSKNPTAIQARAKKIKQFWIDREHEENEIKKEFDKYQIPETLEDLQHQVGHALCAQEIIEATEFILKRELGPRERKYVVCNIIAQDYFMTGKAAGANNYNPEVADLIIERIADGIPIKEVCRGANFPHVSKFFGWLTDNPSLRDRYSLAMKTRTQVWAEEIIELSNNPLLGVEIIQKGDGTTDIKTRDMIERAKLGVDSRKWLMAKTMPEVYGEYRPEKNTPEADGKVHVQIVGGLPDTLSGEKDPNVKQITTGTAGPNSPKVEIIYENGEYKIKNGIEQFQQLDQQQASQSPQDMSTSVPQGTFSSQTSSQQVSSAAVPLVPGVSVVGGLPEVDYQKAKDGE